MAGGGSKPKIAPLPDPIPTPEDISVEAQKKGEDRRRQLRAQAGRRGTILTDTLGTPNDQRSTILGRTG